MQTQLAEMNATARATLEAERLVCLARLEEIENLHAKNDAEEAEASAAILAGDGIESATTEGIAGTWSN